MVDMFVKAEAILRLGGHLKETYPLIAFYLSEYQHLINKQVYGPAETDRPERLHSSDGFFSGSPALRIHIEKDENTRSFLRHRNEKLDKAKSTNGGDDCRNAGGNLPPALSICSKLLELLPSVTCDCIIY